MFKFCESEPHLLICAALATLSEWITMPRRNRACRNHWTPTKLVQYRPLHRRHACGGRLAPAFAMHVQMTDNRMVLRLINPSTRHSRETMVWLVEVTLVFLAPQPSSFASWPSAQPWSQDHRQLLACINVVPVHSVSKVFLNTCGL
jgi:hypothetical protein